jgi:ABC-type lipopolysaccharide export system ATPase subunit
MINKLEVDSIQFEINGKKILSNIYLKCETGSVVGLLGKNGQGKSCLMKIIYGQIHAEKSIRYNNISKTKMFSTPNLLSFVPQFNFLPKRLSVNRVFEDFSQSFSDFQNYFPELKLDIKASLKSLSGGERRLIEIYLLLKSNTQFLMLDEPFTYLSPIQVEKVKHLINSEKINKGIIITDHMYNHILEISDYTYVLFNGQTRLITNLNELETYGYLNIH